MIKKLNKLSNKIVDERLKDRNIKRLEEFINCRTKISFQCLVEGCNYIWATTPDTLFSKKSGCPNCANVAKITNEKIDQQLIEKNIKRIDNCINNKTKINFQCLIPNCNHIWLVDPSHLLLGKQKCPRCKINNTSMPKCGNDIIISGRKLSNDILDRRLSNRSIKRIGNFNRSISKIEFQCLIASCNFKWYALPGGVLYGETGCPKCVGNKKLTNEDIDSKLKDKKIKRLNNYINIDAKNTFECLVENCNYIWSTSVGNIVNTGTGCPKCSRNAKLNNEIIDQRLIGRNIKRLDNYVNSCTKIEWQCLIENCNFIWMTTSNDILNQETGCPNCACGKSERLIHNIFISNNIKFSRHYNIRKINLNESRRMHADFHISNQNIIIEYNGQQHYRPVRFGGISQELADVNFVKQQSRDLYLQQFCDANNIKLIWIDGRTYINSKLEKYIINTIIPLIK